MSNLFFRKAKYQVGDCFSTWTVSDKLEIYAVIKIKYKSGLRYKLGMPSDYPLAGTIWITWMTATELSSRFKPVKLAKYLYV